MKALLRLPFLCLASLLAGTFAQAQTKGGPPRILPPHPRPRPPVIWIDPSQGKLKPMEVQSVDADIKVRGHLATTTLEMTFFNPNTRVLEGELIFPLGEGQTVASYSLEVDGKLRQAVVVEKEKGREVFEEVVRRGIDPGLAEITKGNVFRTRVYPLPPKGTKRVSVTFEQELGEDGKGFRYLLPLSFEEKLKSFHARAEVVKQEVATVVDAKEKGEELTFEKWRDSFVAELKKENEAMTKPLVFTVPKLADRPQIFMVSEKLDPDRMFFNVRVEPEIPVKVERAAVKRVGLFYDASGSAEQRDRKRENAFLAKWLKTLGNVKVDLVAFRNDADQAVTFDIKNGDASELIKAIESLPIDGGTSLGAVDVSSTPEADTVLLMSDGLTNFGPAEPKLSCEGLQVFAIHAAQIADSANLQRLMRKCGGRVLNLLTLNDDDALQAGRGVTFQFLGAKVLSGKADDLVPSLPEPLTRGFTMAGKFKGKTEIELSFGHDGHVDVTRRVVLNPADAMETERGDFVRRAWAQKKIAELMLDAKTNESAITALGKEHRVVTSGTSLIVLDRIEDYARHQIEPPEPELREQYLALVEKMPKNPRNRDEASHLDEVAKQWTEFKDWHAKRHPWLETVIKPAAEREAKFYELLSRDSGSGKPKLSTQDAERARELLEKAKGLAASWNTEGREDKSRALWIRDATDVMMQIDALRQRRIEAVPQSEVNTAEGRPSAPADPFSSGEGRVMSRALADNAPRPGAPPPAPAPVMAPAAEAAAGAGGGFGNRRAEAKKKDGGESGSGLASTIEVKPWNPDTPYLKRIKNADDAYATYLKERKDNAKRSAFFLDCADFFREEKKDDRIALRVLSNLAEMELESAPLLRILAYRLQQIGKHELAVPLFEEVLKMRGEEPQSRRDLALSLSRMEKPDWQRAASLLWEVVKKNWDGRFPGIEIIALHELNDVIARSGKGGVNAEQAGIEKRFLDAVPVDLRVVLTWDADNTDIDLWVTDPAGETCIFNHNRTQTGGRISNDFTQGYGPEVFTITRALPGTYTVRVNYYGNRQQKYSGSTTLQIEFQTAFDQKGSKRQAVTRRLTDTREVIEVGKFTFKPEMVGAE